MSRPTLAHSGDGQIRRLLGLHSYTLLGRPCLRGEDTAIGRGQEIGDVAHDEVGEGIVVGAAGRRRQGERLADGDGDRRAAPRWRGTARDPMPGATTRPARGAPTGDRRAPRARARPGPRAARRAAGPRPGTPPRPPRGGTPIPPPTEPGGGRCWPSATPGRTGRTGPPAGSSSPGRSAPPPPSAPAPPPGRSPGDSEVTDLDPRQAHDRSRLADVGGKPDRHHQVHEPPLVPLHHRGLQPVADLHLNPLPCRGGQPVRSPSQRRDR